ncbi:MAG: adenylate/guanylate cyclase domain-containing protein [Rhodospirillales bacterium]
MSAFVFGARVERPLPARVRNAIADQQYQAEILIGWVQLLLVMFFLALYTIAPKTSAGTAFMPVPYALALYLLFTLVRLLLAYRRILPRWFLMGSIAIDIGLLMVLMWSFHLQYEQPAPFYLKAPTLLYVFLFIALRTLRYEPNYVVAAGTAAAVGWFALVWYAVDNMTPDTGVTRDYVLYLTSNRILIGAEVDKIISILLVTLVLSVAQVRARRLLMRSVADATVAHDLSRFVSPEVADQIVSADRAIQPGDGDVRTATVMFCDIEGFTGISERLEPDVLIQTLNEYFDVFSRIVDQHHGVITQFQGDAMLVSFNTAKPDPNHAANALRTAIAFRQVVSRMRFGPGVVMRTRCGINTGKMISGAVGTRDRLLFTVFGDEVNIAARLEQLNKDYGTYILATEQTMTAADGDFAWRRIGSVTVRGRTSPVEVYAVDEPDTAVETTA